MISILLHFIIANRNDQIYIKFKKGALERITRYNKMYLLYRLAYLFNGIVREHGRCHIMQNVSYTLQRNMRYIHA